MLRRAACAKLLLKISFFRKIELVMAMVVNVLTLFGELEI